MYNFIYVLFGILFGLFGTSISINIFTGGIKNEDGAVVVGIYFTTALLFSISFYLLKGIVF